MSGDRIWHHLRVKVLIATGVLVVAAYIWYPPVRLFGLAVTGHSPVCPLGKALKSRANLDETTKIKDRIYAASKLVKEEAGLELWETPKGSFWIPKGNRF